MKTKSKIAQARVRTKLAAPRKPQAPSATKAVKGDGVKKAKPLIPRPVHVLHPVATAAAAQVAAVTQRIISTPKRISNAKMLPKNFLSDLAQAIRNAVVPVIQNLKGRDIVGTAASGDATFELDSVAEKALMTFLKAAKMPVAYYSEDSGYTTFTSGQPGNLLIVDPIDGTRAAKLGFESCVVAVCSTRVIERPTMADVDNGLVLDILGNRMFYAEKGQGARYYVDNTPRKIKLSNVENLETVAWSMTVPARPADLIFPTAAKLIDLTSLKGGFFACNSTSYSLTRLVSGQLDACVDFANRFYRDIPSLVEDHFINAGRGIVLGICPYDFAAALLIAQEAGCVVTDAYGNSFDDVMLLDSSVSNQRSLIAASTKSLHEKLLSFFDTRIQQFENLLKSRAQAAQN